MTVLYGRLHATTSSNQVMHRFRILPRSCGIHQSCRVNILYPGLPLDSRRLVGLDAPCPGAPNGLNAVNSLAWAMYRHVTSPWKYVDGCGVALGLG